MRGSAPASRLRALPALVVVLLMLVPVDPAGAASKSRPATKAAALPVSQLARDGGLAGVLSELLPGLFGAPAPPPAPVTGPLAPSVVSTVTASTVKVTGVACGSRVAGSGFAADRDTVVTNAHVVAGVGAPQVERPDGRRLPAQVQVFDPDRDLAVLSVPGLGQQPLRMGSAVVGGAGAVFGHPQGRVPVEVSPAVVSRRVDAMIDNIYDQGPVRRQVLVLDSELEPGDSGAALVNESGDVVGVAFAISSWFRGRAFAVATEELSPVLAQPRNGPVSSGPCLR